VGVALLVGNLGLEKAHQFGPIRSGHDGRVMGVLDDGLVLGRKLLVQRGNQDLGVLVAH
jgi:hypothetical protein